MRRFNWRRGILASVAAWVAGLVAFLALFGNPLSQQIIFTEDFGQSDKLLSMWEKIEPLPAVTPFTRELAHFTVKKIAVVALLYFWTLGLVRLYAFVSPQLPENMGRRIATFGGIIWLTFFFFEVFAPFNLMGEPFLLVCFELFLEAIISFAVAGMIVTLYD